MSLDEPEEASYAEGFLQDPVPARGLDELVEPSVQYAPTQEHEAGSQVRTTLTHTLEHLGPSHLGHHDVAKDLIVITVGELFERLTWTAGETDVMAIT